MFSNMTPNVRMYITTSVRPMTPNVQDDSECANDSECAADDSKCVHFPGKSPKVLEGCLKMSAPELSKVAECSSGHAGLNCGSEPPSTRAVGQDDGSFTQTSSNERF